MENINDLIITWLQEGLQQPEIAKRLKQQNIRPNSISSVEKKIRQIKEEHEANTLFHLACILHNKKLLKIEDSHNCE